MKKNLRKIIASRMGNIATGLLRTIVGIFDLRDVFVFGGIGLFGYGIGLIYYPLAFIASGIALFWLGVRKVGNGDH